MEVPASKPYEGPSGIGRESNWLTNEDLVDGRDVSVKIATVLLYPEVKFEGGRTRVNVLGLKFEKAQRILLLNATNRKKLGKAFGNITKAWVGKTITLYVTETTMGRDTVKCIRIRDLGARAASAAEEFLNDDEPTATPAPVANGADDSRALTEACQIAGLAPHEQAALLTKHGGNHAAALAEVNARIDAGNA